MKPFIVILHLAWLVSSCLHVAAQIRVHDTDNDNLGFQGETLWATSEVVEQAFITLDGIAFEDFLPKGNLSIQANFEASVFIASRTYFMQPSFARMTGFSSCGGISYLCKSSFYIITSNKLGKGNHSIGGLSLPERLANSAIS